MATKLIELEEGVLVEVEVPEEDSQKIASRLADKVGSSINKIKPVLINICDPVIEAWQEVNQKMTIEQAEVEIGFGFELEGNIYVSKTTANTNFTIKLILKPAEKTS